MINNFEKITSKQNTKIKWIRSLLSHRQERKNSNCYVLEGVRLIEEAHKANIIPELVLFSSNISTRGNQVLESFKSNTNEIYEVNYDLLRFISKTENPQGIIAVFNKTVLSIPEQADFLLIADGIRDPGNMGTLIRTSLAANVNALILTPGSVDIFSPKVLRSGMGGHLHLPIHTLEWEQIINIFKKDRSINMSYFLAASENGKPYWQPDYKVPSAVIIGSEADGASKYAHMIASEHISIPISKNSESLNAAIAAGIILFEIVRQRSS